MTERPVSIAIFGAGSVGCYLGGCLAAAGVTVTLVGRERVLSGIRSNGLSVSDLYGRQQHVGADRLTLTTDPEGVCQADVVLVTVKSAATEEAGSQLAAVMDEGTCVISFQNGIDNAARLGQCLPNRRVVSGMVPFNVLDRGDGRFHQGSFGDLEVEAAELPTGVEDAFVAAKLRLLRPANMAAVRWGKLLINLNNPINALSGLTLREELGQRTFRRCLAMAQREGLSVLKSAGIEPAKVTPLPPAWLPTLLDTPDWLFKRAAKKMLAIDPLARSSMWEDLERGRVTEIDWINGEIISLAQKISQSAPVNEKLRQLIREAERGGRRDWSGDELHDALASVTQR